MKIPRRIYKSRRERKWRFYILKNIGKMESRRVQNFIKKKKKMIWSNLNIESRLFKSLHVLHLTLFVYLETRLLINLKSSNFFLFVFFIANSMETCTHSFKTHIKHPLYGSELIPEPWKIRLSAPPLSRNKSEKTTWNFIPSEIFSRKLATSL